MFSTVSLLFNKNYLENCHFSPNVLPTVRGSICNNDSPSRKEWVSWMLTGTYTQRVLAYPVENYLILICGLYSLEPSCQTVILALCKDEKHCWFLTVEWKQSLEDQPRINLYHAIFNIGRGMGIYDNDHVFKCWSHCYILN